MSTFSDLLTGAIYERQSQAIYPSYLNARVRSNTVSDTLSGSVTKKWRSQNIYQDPPECQEVSDCDLPDDVYTTYEDTYPSEIFWMQDYVSTPLTDKPFTMYKTTQKVTPYARTTRASINHRCGLCTKQEYVYSNDEVVIPAFFRSSAGHYTINGRDGSLYAGTLKDISRIVDRVTERLDTLRGLPLLFRNLRDWYGTHKYFTARGAERVPGTIHPLQYYFGLEPSATMLVDLQDRMRYCLLMGDEKPPPYKFRSYAEEVYNEPMSHYLDTSMPRIEREINANRHFVYKAVLDLPAIKDDIAFDLKNVSSLVEIWNAVHFTWVVDSIVNIGNILTFTDNVSVLQSYNIRDQVLDMVDYSEIRLNSIETYNDTIDGEIITKEWLAAELETKYIGRSVRLVSLLTLFTGLLANVADGFWTYPSTSTMIMAALTKVPGFSLNYRGR
jgi:hypothetical protein